MRKLRFNPFRNRLKLVEEGLFAIIDLLVGAKTNNLYIIWPLGDDFHKKYCTLIKKTFF